MTISLIKPRLLIVEDYADSAECIARLFGSEGFDCDVAGDIREAVAKFNAACDEGQNCYDVVVLDVHLPSASGLGLLRAIRDVTKDLPIFLLTAYPDDLVKIRASQFGADFDTKPLDDVRGYVQKVAAKAREYFESKLTRDHPRLILPAIIEEMMDRAVA